MRHVLNLCGYDGKGTEVVGAPDRLIIGRGVALLESDEQPKKLFSRPLTRRPQEATPGRCNLCIARGCVLGTRRTLPSIQAQRRGTHFTVFGAARGAAFCSRAAPGRPTPSVVGVIVDVVELLGGDHP